MAVAINYRLGAFGFLASESMTGNYALMDQRLALQWIQNNVAAFGGNPKEVTIAGQSAGGMSVASHLVMPKSRGLFSKAIPESNPLGLPVHTRETAKKNADNVMKYLDCKKDDVACAKTKSAEQVLEAQDEATKIILGTLFVNFMPWAPVAEPGGELPDQILYMMMRGDMARVPILTGSVLDEGQMFVYEMFTEPMSEAVYKAAITATFGVRRYGDIMDLYPYDMVPGSVDGREAFNILATDLLFYCPLRNVTRGYQRALGANAIPTYLYRFEQTLSFDCWGPDYQFCVGWVCHGSELPFVFNVFTDGVSLTFDPTADEQQLTTDISDAWVNFMNSGDPNKGLYVPASFPLYEEATDTILVLQEPGTKTSAHLRSQYCDLWDRLGFIY